MTERQECHVLSSYFAPVGTTECMPLVCNWLSFTFPPLIS